MSKMTYEETPISKKVSKEAKNSVLTDVKTGSMLWHIVKRHKFGLVATYAVAITVLYFVPMTGDLLRTAILGV